MIVRWRLVVVFLVAFALVLVIGAASQLPTFLSQHMSPRISVHRAFRGNSNPTTISNPSKRLLHKPLSGNLQPQPTARETYTSKEHCTLPEGFPTEPLDFEQGKKYLLSEEKGASFRIVPCPNGKVVPGCESTVNFPRFAEKHRSYREKFGNRTHTALRHRAIGSAVGEWDRSWGPVLVLSVNKGYLFLFGNWVCSCLRAGLDLRPRVLVITGDDDETAAEVKRLGFKTFSSKWYLPSDGRLLIQPEAPKGFSMGSHMATNLVAASLAADLVVMGYDVLLQDVDVVWSGDPFAYLNRHPESLAWNDDPSVASPRRMDITMMDDGRRDKVGPGNSGFVVIRSNCRTKLFMQTYVLNSHFIEFGGRSDQRYWNALLRIVPYAKKIRYGVLPLEEFTNGHVLKSSATLSDKCLVLHASYTGTIFKKIRKLDFIDHWFYTAERCPLYNPALDPFKLTEWQDDPFTISTFMQVELSSLQTVVGEELQPSLQRLRERLFRLESLVAKKITASEGKKKKVQA